MKKYSDIALECIDDGVRGRAEKFVEKYLKTNNETK